MSEWFTLLQLVCWFVVLGSIYISVRVFKVAVRRIHYAEKQSQKLIFENEKLSDENKDLRHQLLVLKTRNVR